MLRTTSHVTYKVPNTFVGNDSTYEIVFSANTGRKQINGKKNTLKSSQAYPKLFGKAVAHTILKHSQKTQRAANAVMALLESKKTRKDSIACKL